MFFLLACLHSSPPPPVETLATVGWQAGDTRAQRALELLLSASNQPYKRLTPTAVREAQDAVGLSARTDWWLFRPDIAVPTFFPGSIYALREFSAGLQLGIAGQVQAHRSLAPLPAQPEPGESVWLRVSGNGKLRLVIGGPLDTHRLPQQLREEVLWGGTGKQLEDFSVGEYRVEIIDGENVEHLFSLFVGLDLPVVSPLPGPLAARPTSVEIDWLRTQLDALRFQQGLPPLHSFSLTQKEVQQHAHCLAQEHSLNHESAHCPALETLLSPILFPRPDFWEVLAIGDSAADAWEALLSSPAHLLNLIQPKAEAISIASAPTPEGGRLFVIAQFSFPSGPPIDVRLH